MKRFVSLILSLLMSLAMTACGGASDGATIRVENGAFNWKAQELIDALNTEIENTGDSRYFSIPDFSESGEKIIIDDSSFDGLVMILENNEEEYVTKISIEWCTFGENVERVNTCALLVGRLIGSIAPEQAEEIYSQLDMDATGTPEYTTEYTVNSVDFVYNYRLKGMNQSLTVSPTAA